MIRKPSPDDLYKFVYSTHAVEKLPVTFIDVLNTANTQKKNWYADGHLRAFSTAVNKITPSTDFPTRFPELTHPQQSDEALHWLKTLHLLMLEPVARNPVTLVESGVMESRQQESILPAYLGVWRTQPAGNLMGPAPQPPLILPIMHRWLIQLKSIHDKVKDNVQNPYGISKQQYREMLDFVKQQPAFFSSVQPFKDANNRFGRLIENVLRCVWYLPFKANVEADYDTFKESLEPFQTQILPQLIKNARLGA